MNRKNISVVTFFVLISFGLIALPAGAMTTQGVDVHGFISQGFLYSDEYNYLAHNSTDGSFEYNEFGINFSKNLTDRLRMGLQFFSRDLGDVSNNKITVDWAYGDYRVKDWLGIRAGRIKLPMGLYNEYRDVDILRTCIVLPQGIYNELLRDNLIGTNGVGIYGNVKIGGLGGLEYQALAGAMNTAHDGGARKFMDNGLLEYGGEATDVYENDTAYAGSLRWETPLSGLRIGYTCFNSHSINQISFAGGALLSTLDSESTLHIGSAEFIWNDLTVAGEYMLRDCDVTILSMSSSADQEAYYVSAAYMFTDWFSMGAYYSIYYQYKDDKDGDNLSIDHQAWQKDLALTLRFDINEYWIIKIEGHAMDGTANVLNGDNLDNEFSESDWYYGATKVTFSF